MSGRDFYSVYGGAVQGNKQLLSSVQDHFRLQKYGGTAGGLNKNEFFRTYNQKLAKQFDDMMNDRGFNIYQNGLIKSDAEHEGIDKLLINSEHISPLLKALEDENSVLKKEITYLSGDLKKFISMVELLLEENKYIREHINQKNRDITKLIETIGLNDGEEIHDLKHKIHILTEENNILIKHLDEMKKFREDYDNFVYQNENEMGKAKQVFEKAHEDLEAALRREENLAKQVQNLEPNYLKLKKLTAEQEDDIEQFKIQLNDKDNYIQQIENELNHYKRNYEDLNTKKQLENDQLLQENHLLQNEKKDFKSKFQLKEKQIHALQDDNKQVRREHQQISQQLAEISSSVTDFKNQIEIEKSRAESSLQRERQMREKLDLALNETEKATLKLQQLQKQYNQLLDSSKQEMSEKFTKYESNVERLKNQYQEQLEEKEDESNQQSKQLNEQKRIIERMQSDLELKNKDIAEQKHKLQDYQHQKTIIDAQTLELRQQQKEIQELGGLLNEYKSQLQSQPEQRNEQDKLLRQIQDLQDKLRSLQNEGSDMRFNEQLELAEQRIDNLNHEKKQMENENRELSNQVSEMKRELDGMMELGVNTRLSKKDQENKVHQLQSEYTHKINLLQAEIRKLEDKTAQQAIQIRNLENQRNSNIGRVAQISSNYNSGASPLQGVGQSQYQPGMLQHSMQSPPAQSQPQSALNRAIGMASRSPVVENQFKQYFGTQESPNQIRSSKRIFDNPLPPQQYQQPSQGQQINKNAWLGQN